MIDLPPEAWEALALSLRVSLVATLASLPLAIWVAHLLARGRFRGRGLLDAAVHLPLVLPPVVTGYALLLLFSRAGPLGGVLEPLGLGLAFRWTGAALAAAIMAFPLMVRSIRLAIEAVDPRLEEAAATLGASPFRVWRSVTLPLMAPGRSGRRDAGLREGVRRVRRDDHLRRLDPRRDADAALRDLRLPSGAGGARRRCAALSRSPSRSPSRRCSRRTGWRRASPPAWRAADARGGDPAARRHVRPRRRPLRRLRRDRALRPVGRGQDDARALHRRARAARRGPDRAGRPRALGAGRGRARASARHRLRLPGAAALPASRRARQPALRRAAGLRSRRGRGDARHRVPDGPPAAPICRGARRRASRSAARCCGGPRSSSSTSRWPRWTPGCARGSCPISNGCATPVRRSSTSATPSRRWRGWPPRWS